MVVVLHHISLKLGKSRMVKFFCLTFEGIHGSVVVKKRPWMNCRNVAFGEPPAKMWWNHANTFKNSVLFQLTLRMSAGVSKSRWF